MRLLLLLLLLLMLFVWHKFELMQQMRHVDCTSKYFYCFIHDSRGLPHLLITCFCTLTEVEMTGFS